LRSQAQSPSSRPRECGDVRDKTANNAGTPGIAHLESTAPAGRLEHRSRRPQALRRPSVSRWLQESGSRTATPAVNRVKWRHSTVLSEFGLPILNGAQRAVNRKVQGSNPLVRSQIAIRCRPKMSWCRHQRPHILVTFLMPTIGPRTDSNFDARSCVRTERLPADELSSGPTSFGPTWI
jgi:hypothetical protein